jgi:hypothetical protein
MPLLHLKLNNPQTSVQSVFNSYPFYLDLLFCWFVVAVVVVVDDDDDVSVRVLVCNPN